MSDKIPRGKNLAECWRIIVILEGPGGMERPFLVTFFFHFFNILILLLSFYDVVP